MQPTAGQRIEPEKKSADDIMSTQSQKGLLRLVTCGSVDDGKSTLIGRLLYDSEQLYEDQLAVLRHDSRGRPTFGGTLDFSLLVDGLQAEREQSITIDVAYRYFETASRKFILADSPGHEQYTRNMVTAASKADLAILLVDARKGILLQTRRHAYICSLLGIRHFCVVVNKMDTVDYDRRVFEGIHAKIITVLETIGAIGIQVLPISAVEGDNVARRSDAMPWYTGPSLIEHLEAVDIAAGIANAAESQPFRLPVQRVNRPFDDFRGFSGVVASGVISPGDTVRVARSGMEGKVKRIVTFDGDRDDARSGDAVTVVLDRELDISRGDILAYPEAPPYVADQFRATLIWMAEDELLPGRSYLIRVGTAITSGSITKLRHKVDMNTLGEVAVRSLALNDLGSVNLATDSPVGFDAYTDNRRTGCFIMIDRHSGSTVGAGVIEYPLRRASNLAWQAFDVTRAARAAIKRQTPAIVWLTGLSGSGKSTIANLVERKLFADGRHVYVLDGDNVRHGLNRDLGFTDADRVENIRRVAQVARLMADAGLIVIVSFISPFRSERELARQIAEDIVFYEVFIDTPLSVCEARDPKGLYRKARSGEIMNFTGIHSNYQPPRAPELRIETTAIAPEDAADLVVDLLKRSTR
jgi:bifunctional enzyme CysN/CysC